MKKPEATFEELNGVNVHRIGIIGAGFVGTACELGFATLRNAQVSVYDKYKQTQSLGTVVNSSDIIFVCVPTPMNPDGSCNVAIVKEVVADLVSVAEDYKNIVIKSTVPPGTTRELQRQYPKHALYFNPEFLTEANFISDFARQEFIIIGQTCDSDNRALKALYDDFILNQTLVRAKIHWTTAEVAELCKYSINCFLATKVAFFNEIYAIAEKCGIDYQQVANLVKQDKRIGTSHMQVPGPDGKVMFSGACFCKDLNALMSFADQQEVLVEVMQAVWRKNLRLRPEKDWEKIHGVLSGHGKTKHNFQYELVE